MIDATTLLRRNPRVESRSMGEGEGGVLLHLDTAAYHGLNEVGVLIWSLLEEPKAFEAPHQELRISSKSYLSDSRRRSASS